MQKAAVSAGGIATALQKSATSAKLAGMSMDELIGSVSVIGEVTQQSMDTVGNAMKSILARYGNVKASVFTQMGLNDDGETSENINDIEKVLSKLGIRIRSSAGELRSITDVLDDVNEKWSTYDTVTKNAIATSFGGTRMRENFLVLIENWDRVKELTEESANAAGTADEKYEAYTDSIEAGLKRIQNAWENVSQKFEGSWLIKTGIGFMEKFISHLDTLTRLLTIFAATKFSDKIFTFGANTVKKTPNLLKKLTGLGVSSEGSVTYDEKGNMVVTPQETQRDFLIRKGTQTIVDTLNKNGVDTNTILNQIKILIEEISLGAKAQYDPNTGKIISGLSVNGKDVKYEGLDTSGKRIFKYNSGKRITSKKRLADLNRQQDLIEEYNKNLGSPANPNQISGYVGQTWWGGAAKNVTIGGKTYTRSRVPKQIYGTKYAYIDEYGNDIKDISIDQSQQIDELNKKLQQQKKGTRLKAGATAGITSALGALATTKQVGGGTIGKMITGSDISVEENFGDKAIRAGASGALAAVGGYFLGPLGAMLGQTIGEGAASIVSTIIHRSEIQLKQRVQDAKENLQALDSVKSAVDNGVSVMSSAIATSDDYAKLKEYTDNLSDTLYDYISEYGKEFFDSIISNLVSSGIVEENEITEISDLMQLILDGDDKERELIQKQIDIALIDKKMEQTEASNEETLSKALTGRRKFKTKENYGTTGYDDEGKFTQASKNVTTLLSEKGFLVDENNREVELGKLSASEGVEKINEILKENKNLTEDSRKALENYRDELQGYANDLQKIRKENIENASQKGLLVSGLLDFDKRDVEDWGLDGLIMKVAQVTDNAKTLTGTIRTDYYNAIKTAIKSNSHFNSILQKSSSTIGDLTSKQKAFKDLTNKDGGGIVTVADSWERWYEVAMQGKLEDSVAKVVFAANPERIKLFANAWNMTVEEAEKLADKLPGLTTALGSMTPSEVLEYYTNLSDIFSDLADNAILTAKNFDEIISKYPKLMALYGRTDKEDLQAEILKSIGVEQKTAYSNALLNEFLDSEGYVSLMRTGINGDEDWGENENEYVKDALSLNTMRELYQRIAYLKNLNTEKSNAAAQALEDRAVALYGKDMEIEWEDPLYTAAKEAEIYNQDKIIKNLEEQKDALGKINDERKKEIELIKARDALENAKKEKVRVYRAGKINAPK